MFQDLGGKPCADLGGSLCPALLFQRGDQSDYLVALTSGRVRLANTAPQGHELIRRHAGAGEILGYMALFDAELRSADAVAAREAELV